MSNIVYFPSRRDAPSDSPESATIIELALIGKIWARTGSVGLSSVTMFFIETDGCVHGYQKGGGVNDHVLFWSAAVESSFGADSKIIEFLFGCEWEDE